MKKKAINQKKLSDKFALLKQKAMVFKERKSKFQGFQRQQEKENTLGIKFSFLLKNSVETAFLCNRT